MTSRTAVLVVIILAALALRLFFLLLTRDITPIHDEAVYVRMAKEVLESGDFRARWLWPPGQAYFMAGIFSIFGVSILAVKVAQTVLSAFTVYLLYLICRQTFGNERTALLAGALAAVYPNLIAFSHYLWSETLFIFLFLAFIYLLLRSTTSWKYRLLTASGVFFALGCLTRPVLLSAFAVVLVYLWTRFRARRRVLILSVVVFTATAGAVMTPWLVRTVGTYGGWIGIAPSSQHLWRGNSGIFEEAEQESDFSRDKYNQSGSRVLERDRYALRKGIENIRSEQPYWILKKGIVYLQSWAYQRSFVLRHMKLGLYGDIPQSTRSLLVGYIHFAYLAVMLAAILGLCWTGYRPEKKFMIGLIVVFSAVYIVTISRNARLRLPLEAILIMFSAEGFLLVGRLVRWTRDRGWRSRGLDPSLSEMSTMGRPALPPARGRVPLRAALYCILTGIFIYVCSTDMSRVVRGLFR